MGADNTLEMAQTLNAVPELIFRIWTEAEQLRSWFGGTGFEVVEASADAQVGGKWSVTLRGADSGNEWQAVGEYRELDSPHRIAMTMAWLMGEGNRSEESLLTLVLTAQGDKTEVALTQTGFNSPEMRDRHRDGWQSSFALMEKNFT